VNGYDPDLHEPQQRLNAIDARLAQHEQTTRLTLSVFSLLAGLALALRVNVMPHCATLLERLLRSLP